MPKSTEITIGEAKGRPMLHWVGKQPLDRVTAYPAQLVETFNPTGDDAPAQGLLFHGDNKDVLAWLLANGYRGKVDLIYIDPPFDSGADYVRKVELRGIRGTSKIDGEPYRLGEQIQYTDIWANDTYLQFLYERLLLLKELLSQSGNLVIHCDYHRSHFIRCLTEEVFAESGFVAEVVWKRSQPRGNVLRGLSTAHDALLIYANSSDSIWNLQFNDLDPDYIKSHYRLLEPATGRKYRLDNLISPNPNRPNLDYMWNDVRRVWRVTKENMAALQAQGRIVYSSTGVAQYKRYLDETKGTPLTTWWDDIPPVNSQASEREDYPTQKPEKLLERVLQLASCPNSLILDCFIGSGTTAAVAQKLGRRWIAADINKGAIQTTSKRLQGVIRELIEAHAAPQQGTLELIDAGDDTPAPTALSFSLYRVNDYDLQIQHNEAVNLVVEHLGIDRTRTDSYFDGTQGKKLVKIIAFNHPLTPLDLQALQDELGTRPDEDRDILVVCLGKETTVAPWLEEYNRHRPINKIDVIELRTDQKYGKFLVHEAAQADVAIRREGEEVVIEIVDFISPTIVKRLEMDLPLFKAQIPDWRAMVNVVLIDTSYDGEVFDITRSDVPARKNDLVVGEYRLPVAEGETTVAVKIIDMLGEEVLVVGEI